MGLQIGKDRTGLLAAMLLSCCGASDDEIVSDYMRSAPSLMLAAPESMFAKTLSSLGFLHCASDSVQL